MGVGLDLLVRSVWSKALKSFLPQRKEQEEREQEV
jgi:hypothetical protein